MNKITIVDIAKAADVSVSTASKALTGKGRISQETRKKVQDTAEKLGYMPNKAAQALSRKALKIGAIVPDGPREVQQHIENGLSHTFRLMEEFGIECIIKKYNARNDNVEVNRLLEQMMGNVDGIIVQPGYHLESYRANLEQLSRKNTALLSLLTGIEYYTGIGSVTIHETVVGKMAAEFLNISAKNNNMAIITGDKDVLIHRKNIEGFVQIGETFGFNIGFIEESFDDMDIAYRLTKRILESNADVSGIFVTSYVAPAVCECLKYFHRQHEIAVVGMDLFAESIGCIKDQSLNAVIFQNQFQQAKRAVETMADYLGGHKVIVHEKIKPELVMLSNLECYID